MRVPRMSGAERPGASTPPRWTQSGLPTRPGSAPFGQRYSKLKRWLASLKASLPRSWLRLLGRLMVRSGRRQLISAERQMRRARWRIRFGALLQKIAGSE